MLPYWDAFSPTRNGKLLGKACTSTFLPPTEVRKSFAPAAFRGRRELLPMVRLPTDVAPSGVSAKRAFETVFKARVSVLEWSLIQNGRPHRTTAQSITAPAIGDMVVARTMVDRALADKLRDACTAVALNFGG
jgi:hypothetical protein